MPFDMPKRDRFLGVENKSGKALIRIDDTGPGIDPEHHQRIFEEFQQVGTQIKREGAGLGLSISQRIARLLETEIAVVSALGKGSSFSLSLKQGKPKTGDTEAPKARQTRASDLLGKTVLYVDNDQNALDSLSALLQGWGCDIRTALGPEQAFDAFSEPPELVIFDYQLDDGWTGDQLFERLCANWGQRPAGILVTAEDSGRTKDAAVRLSVERLLKPVPPAALRALVSQTFRES